MGILREPTRDSLTCTSEGTHDLVDLRVVEKRKKNNNNNDDDLMKMTTILNLRGLTHFSHRVSMRWSKVNVLGEKN